MGEVSILNAVSIRSPLLYSEERASHLSTPGKGFSWIIRRSAVNLPFTAQFRSQVFPGTSTAIQDELPRGQGSAFLNEMRGN